jgi:hypothetical protein
MTNINEQKSNSDMTNKAADAKATDANATLGKDIRAKWDKFSEIEVSAMKSEDDLVSQLVAKYSIDKAQAETQAKSVVAGRAF